MINFVKRLKAERKSLELGICPLCMRVAHDANPALIKMAKDWLTIEIFGRMRGVQLGCAGCVGVTHHPNWKLLDILMAVPPTVVMLLGVCLLVLWA